MRSYDRAEWRAMYLLCSTWYFYIKMFTDRTQKKWRANCITALPMYVFDVLMMFLQKKSVMQFPSSIINVHFSLLRLDIQNWFWLIAMRNARALKEQFDEVNMVFGVPIKFISICSLPIGVFFVHTFTPNKLCSQMDEFRFFCAWSLHNHMQPSKRNMNISTSWIFWIFSLHYIDFGCHCYTLAML